MSIRLKVALILAVACVLGDAVFIAFWQPWYLSQALKRERQALQGHLVTLGDAVTPFLLQDQIAAVYEIFDATLERQPEWRSLTLRDSDNLTLYPLEPARLTAMENAEHLTHVIELRNRQLGKIELIADLSPQIQSLKRSIWLTLAFVTLGVALVGLLIGITLEIVVGRRARKLVLAAEMIGRGDFSSSVPEGNADEIGQVAQALNSMRESIAANEKLLVEARVAAEQSDQAKSAFLATMSHEIRTPMNGILGMAQLLLESTLSESERRDYARTIFNSGQSLLTLLNDILDISKIEAGRFELESSVYDPKQLLHEIQALHSPTARGKGLQLDAAWQGPSRRYIGDAHRLRQMLTNLTGNAIKFTPKGHIQIEASEISQCDQEVAILEFSITDTGIGIPKEKQGLLFKPFSQVDSTTTRQFGGTGLGLSIVHRLAQMMGGSAGVISEQGEGSRFWFRIQAKTVAEGNDSREQGRPALATERQAGWPGQMTGHILLVEDNLTNRKVATAILKKLGLTVTEAEDGQQCMDAMSSGSSPDLILMDLNMPVMDGYAATQELRHWEAEQGRPRHPIVALTADAFETDRQHCLEVGMDDFLTKPIVLATLKDVLAKWLKALPQGARPDTKALEAHRPLDIVRVRRLVDELMPILEQNRFDAFGIFDELHGLLAGTEFAKATAEMKQDLDQLKFDLVRKRLGEIAVTQHWTDISP